MRNVKLYAATGGFVVAGQVPPFMEGQEAEVLLWGSRVFKLNRASNGVAIADHDAALLYTETFAVALVVTTS